ncbi:MAG: hypothetical protein AVDCRST_MAG75-326, partial [uncultured Propionibacteriaceae bacterium]
DQRPARRHGHRLRRHRRRQHRTDRSRWRRPAGRCRNRSSRSTSGPYPGL